MAASTCAKCGNVSFEVKTIEPVGGNFKQNLLQCRGCGAPVGVLDYYNLGGLLKDQEKEIAGLKRQLSNVESGIGQILQCLQRMQR